MNEKRLFCSITNSHQVTIISISTKLSPQKTAVEITQKESKNGNAASIDVGQQRHQIKQAIKFIQSTMQT